MNPLITLLEVVHKHMSADSDDIYIESLRLLQYCATELDGHDYETDGDGEKIVVELQEAVAEFESSFRETEETEDDDTDLDRSTEDLDDDEIPTGNFTPTEEVQPT